MGSESGYGDMGSQVGNYCLLRLLGRGGFADVYLGEHIYLKTQAAIKILRVRSSDAEMEEVLNEARTIARLEHPNIVRVLECGIKDDHLFLVMNYAPRGTLRQRYPQGARLPPLRILAYVQQVASALQYAHDQKLIHRDVKPENMLLGQNEQILLSDFGLVMIAQTSLSHPTRNMAGTVSYMSPEQLQGRPRYASDQYALAVVVYEWLCGMRPFTGSFVEVASQQVLSSPPSLCARVPGLLPEVEWVVFKALAKNPADRFESVIAFERAFAQALAIPAASLYSAFNKSSSEQPAIEDQTTLLRGALQGQAGSTCDGDTLLLQDSLPISPQPSFTFQAAISSRSLAKSMSQQTGMLHPVDQKFPMPGSAPQQGLQARVDASASLGGGDGVFFAPGNPSPQSGSGAGNFLSPASPTGMANIQPPMYNTGSHPVPSQKYRRVVRGVTFALVLVLLVSAGVVLGLSLFAARQSLGTPSAQSYPATLLSSTPRQMPAGISAGGARPTSSDIATTPSEPAASLTATPAIRKQHHATPTAVQVPTKPATPSHQIPASLGQSPTSAPTPTSVPPMPTPTPAPSPAPTSPPEATPTPTAETSSTCQNQRSCFWFWLRFGCLSPC